MNYLESAWREPDNGLWEVRGDRRHHSKIMAWAAADRMARSVRGTGLPGPAPQWEALREQIHHDVVTHAFDAERNTFTQAYGSAALDASLLLIPRVASCPPPTRGCWARSPRSAANSATATWSGAIRPPRPTTASRAARACSSPARSGSWTFSRLRAAAGRHRPVRASARPAQRRRAAERGMGPGRTAPAGQHPPGVQPLRPGRQRPPAAYGADGPQRQSHADMTAGPAAVINRVTLVVSDLDRAQDDYVRTFGCRVEHRGDIDPALVRVLCIRRARGRRSLLRLGRERIEFLEFTEMAGRPYPLGSTSTDLWFQHMAIVVTDMRRLLAGMANRRFRPISRNGPVRLPDDSGGVMAFKFRDQDGHPLERSHSRRETSRDHGAPATVPAPLSGSITPPSRSATRPAAPGSSGPSSGSAPQVAENRGPNKPISMTSTTCTSASPGSRRTCPRPGWSCWTTMWARAGRSRTTSPATTSWPRTVWCGSPRSTRPPQRSPAAARPGPG